MFAAAVFCEQTFRLLYQTQGGDNEMLIIYSPNLNFEILDLKQPTKHFIFSYYLVPAWSLNESEEI